MIGTNATDIVWEPYGEARCARLSLGPDLAFLAQARRFTETVAAEAGLSPDRTYDLKVAVSEACANALEHGGTAEGTVQLCAWLREDTLTIEVKSPSPFLLRSGPALEGREHRGMGLPLMIALTDEINVRREPQGGTVVALAVYLAPHSQDLVEETVEPGQLARERQRAQAFDKLAQARTSELESTFDALDHPILIFDSHGRVSRANTAAVEQVGFDPIGLERADLLRRLEISHPNGQPLDLTDLPSWRATLGQPTRGRRLVITAAQGRRRLTEVSSATLDLPGGGRGAVLTWRDVTDQERIESERRQGMRLAMALNEITRRMATTFDQDLILSSVTELAAQSLGVPYAVVTRRTDDEWIVRHEYLAPSNLGQAQREQLRNEALRALSVTELPSLEQTDASGGTIHQETEETRQAYLSAPLRDRGRVSGAIAFIDLGPRPFSSIEQDFAGKVAAALSVAWENARLYEIQLRMSQTLQSALLTMPEEAPGVRFGHLHVSATEEAAIGADFYDLFLLPEKRLGVLIGDVSGKGVEGAAAASLVKNVLKAYAYQLSSPGEIMQRANEMLLLNSPSGGFTTALLLLVDVGRGTMSYSNAGHPPPLIKRAMAEVDLLPTGSPVLGVMPGARFGWREETLRPGDLLLLYTDGVTEARRLRPGGDIDFFGERRLIQTFSRLTAGVTEVPELVFREVAEFSEGELADDIALLCLELSPHP